mmetsp:Transcript_7841/g.23600  ORF Transcript_7841/g.23600 Transcript_7841/m.23600 type:complete len:81 (-) Transcript_7841:1728-1970(-)
MAALDELAETPHGTSGFAALDCRRRRQCYVPDRAGQLPRRRLLAALSALMSELMSDIDGTVCTSGRHGGLKYWQTLGPAL